MLCDASTNLNENVLKTYPLPRPAKYEDGEGADKETSLLDLLVIFEVQQRRRRNADAGLCKSSSYASLQHLSCSADARLYLPLAYEEKSEKDDLDAYIMSHALHVSP